MKKNIFLFFLVTLSLGCLWEFSSRQWVQYRFLLPPLSAILLRMWENASLFAEHTKMTFLEMIGGFILASLAAFPLAWMMYFCKSSRLIIQPLFVVLQSIPMFTLAPIMVFWFGWSFMAIVIPTALMIFLPLTLNLYQGLLSTPKNLLEYFNLYDATSWQIFSKLQLPWSLPHIFAGFRTSAVFAGIGAIAGEWAGAQSGLGVLMLSSRRATDLEVTFGALLCLVFLSMGLYSVITYAELRYRENRSRRLLFLFVLGALLTTVGFTSHSFAIKATENNTLRLLLDWLPNSNHVPIYVGIDRKIFEKYGIQVQILEINDPSDTIPYVTCGAADLALFYAPDMVQAKMNGAEIYVAATLIDQPLNSFIFKTDASILKPQDLTGKIIGYAIAGSNVAFLKRLLEENHIHPKELKNINFDLVALLGTSQVDVIYGAFWNIEKEHLKALNIQTSHFTVSDLGHPLYSELVFISSKDKNFEPFKRALQESIDFCITDPEEAFASYSASQSEKSKATLNWEKEAWLKTVPLLAKSQEINLDQWIQLENWLRK